MTATQPTGADVKALSEQSSNLLAAMRKWADSAVLGDTFLLAPMQTLAMVDDIIAAITTLQSRLALAEAATAVVVQFCERHAEYDDAARRCRLCGTAHDDEHETGCPHGNPSTAAQALLAERDGLKDDLAEIYEKAAHWSREFALERARTTLAEQQRDALQERLGRVPEGYVLVRQCAVCKGSASEGISECVRDDCPHFIDYGDDDSAAREPDPATSALATCGLCGLPMPPGEEVFKYHGHSGPCPIRPATEAGQKREGG